MKILLINNNPVVSRLTALSARKEDVEIDEIQEVTELSSDTYDIVFVDADSWSKDVRDVIADNIKTQKSVLFYTDGDEEEKRSFDLSILKPFLPSEVSAVIRSIEEYDEVSEENENKENHFNVLDEPKLSNGDELFDLDGLDDKKETLAETDNVSFDEKLEEAFPLKVNSLDDDLFDAEPKVDLDLEEASEKQIEEPKKIDDDLFNLDLSDEIPTLEDDLFSDDKKEKTSELLEDLELSEEVIKVETPVEEDAFLALEMDDEKVDTIDTVEKETQVLDKTEIETIKGILTEDISDDMELDDLMTPLVSSSVSIEKEESQEREIDKKVPDIDSSELAQTLTSMPVGALRELLAGAKVNITIKFPRK